MHVETVQELLEGEERAVAELRGQLARERARFAELALLGAVGEPDQDAALPSRKALGDSARVRLLNRPFETTSCGVCGPAVVEASCRPKLHKLVLLCSTGL
jgi:hypothetical protein